MGCDEGFPVGTPVGIFVGCHISVRSPMKSISGSIRIARFVSSGPPYVFAYAKNKHYKSFL